MAAVVLLEDAPAAPLPASPSAAAASARRGCFGTLRPSSNRRDQATVLAMLPVRCACVDRGWDMILID